MSLEAYPWHVNIKPGTAKKKSGNDWLLALPVNDPFPLSCGADQAVYPIELINQAFTRENEPHAKRGQDFPPGSNQELYQTKDTLEIPKDFNFEEFIRPSFRVFQAEPIKIEDMHHDRQRRNIDAK